MKRCTTLACVAIVYLGLNGLSQAAQRTPTVTLEGVEGEVADNIRAYLSLDDEPCDAPSWRIRGRFKKADQEIRRALQAFGYYRPTIQSRLTPATDGGCWEARFTIEPGERVEIRRLQVAVEGEAADDPAFAPVLQANALKVGQPLRQDRYEALKRAISSLALSRGYFEGRFTVHELRVDPVAGHVDIRLRYDSGPRFRFGPTRIEQDVISEGLMRRFLSYREGQPYHRRLIDETSRGLIGSGYFKHVLVQPLVDEARGGVVPIRITATPGKRHRYAVGIGFSTDIGPRLRLGYQNRRLNRRGHKLSGRLSLSQVESTAELGYVMPLHRPMSDRLKFDVGYKYENTDTFRSDTVAVKAARTRKRRSGWLQEEFVAFGHEDFKVGGESTRTRLLMPGISRTRVVADHRLYPRRGYRLTFKAQGGLSQLVSDISFLQLIANTKGILDLPRRSRLIARADLGTSIMDEFDELPASVRFFAGGDTSVRGYAFKSLGPKNAKGDVLGGKQLLVGSIGLDHLLTEKWGVAVFLDSGNAFDKTPVNPKTGVGLGIRWHSPVGPIRIDFAYALNKDDSPFRIHFSMGPDL